MNFFFFFIYKTIQQTSISSLRNSNSILELESLKLKLHVVTIQREKNSHGTRILNTRVPAFTNWSSSSVGVWMSSFFFLYSSLYSSLPVGSPSNSSDLSSSSNSLSVLLLPP